MSSSSSTMAASGVPGRFDQFLLPLAQQSGSMEALLDAFFEFLHRKTDLYVTTTRPAARGLGFPPGQAQQRVLAAFHKYPFKNIDEEEKAPPAQRPSSMPTPQRQATSPQKQSTVAKHTAPVVPVNAEPAIRPPPVRSTPTPPTVRLTDKGTQQPIGNGGVTDTYTWTQTLEEVTIQMELPDETRARDLDCQIQSQHIRIARKDEPSVVLLEGLLPERIRPSESVWSVESNRTLLITLEKVRATWWSSVLCGDAEIDTNAVDSTKKIHEYDETTQAAIRKAMFNQQQQQRGLPTTDEMETEAIVAQAKRQPHSPI